MVSICHGAAHAVKSHGIQGCRIGWKGEVYYDGEEEGTMNDDFSLFIYIYYILCIYPFTLYLSLALSLSFFLAKSTF